MPGLFNTWMVTGAPIEGLTDQYAVRASELISGNRLSAGNAGSLVLGDGLCIAVAERLDLPVTESDWYWERLDLRIEYLPFR